MLSLTQGETLLILVKRDGRPADEIAAALNVDKSYLPKLCKMDFLPPKPLRMAKTVFPFAERHFTDSGEKNSVVEEPQALYHTAASNASELVRLQQENTALRAELERVRQELEKMGAKNDQLTEAVLHLSKRG